MSFMDLIFGQKTILLTIGIAVFILMAAALLLLVPRMRGFFANRARQRAIARKEAAMLAERVEPDPIPAPAPVVIQPTVAAATPTTAASSSPQPAAAAKPAQGAADAAQTTAASAEQKPEVSSAMQDILSSVFADSEASERYQILLKGTEDVNSADLLALSKRVADQVRLQYPAPVNK